MKKHEYDESCNHCRTQFGILGGMNRVGKHIYAGTVSAKDKNKRRAQNRVARKSRKGK